MKETALTTIVARSRILTIKSSDKIYVKAIATGQKDFLSSIRANIRALWSGEDDLADFLDSIRAVIEFGYRRAWYEGGRECGILPDEMTVDELIFLRRRILSDIIRADNLATDVWNGRKSKGGKLYSFYPRADLWANNYNEVRNMAQLMSCQDQKRKWVVDARESCPSCLALAGKVKRMSYWREHDVYPQHRSKLDCMIGAGGVPVCKCSFEKTDERVTPGPLPSLP